MYAHYKVAYVVAYFWLFVEFFLLNWLLLLRGKALQLIEKILIS